MHVSHVTFINMQLYNVTSVWLLLAVLALIVHAEQQYDDKDQQAADPIGVSFDMNGGPGKCHDETYEVSESLF